MTDARTIKSCVANALLDGDTRRCCPDCGTIMDPNVRDGVGEVCPSCGVKMVKGEIRVQPDETPREVLERFNATFDPDG